jgi:hypothetical protein
MGDESAEGSLLHLVSLAVIITTGYIGLDRVHREPDAFWNELRAAEQNVENMLSSRLDIRKPSSSSAAIILNPLVDSYLVYALCFVANIKIKLSFSKRFYHFINRQIYLPFWGYFRKRRDRKVVIVLAIIEVVTLLILTGGIVWKIEWLEITWQLRAAFIYTWGIILWILATVACSYPLNRRRISTVTETLMKRAEELVPTCINQRI